MKKLLTLLIILCSMLQVNAQNKKRVFKPHPKSKVKEVIPKRYWLYEVSFTVDSGCSNSCHGTFSKLSKDAANFDDVKLMVSQWLHPYKLIRMTLTALTEIPEREMLLNSDIYTCNTFVTHSQIFEGNWTGWGPISNTPMKADTLMINTPSNNPITLRNNPQMAERAHPILKMLLMPDSSYEYKNGLLFKDTKTDTNYRFRGDVIDSFPKPTFRMYPDTGFSWSYTKPQNDIIKNDTIKVLALCIINEKRGKTKWKLMYNIHPDVNSVIISSGSGDLIIGGEYLMPDRKTKSIYKIIYSKTLN